MNLRIMLSLLHNLEQLRKHEGWTREQLQAHQAKALRDQRNHAYAHSPFYQEFHKGLTDRPLQELPVLTKAMMMEHYDELVTDRAIHLDALREHATNNTAGDRFLNRYWVNATSGSSGHPGFFLYDESEWAAILASFARGQEWAGIRVNLLRQTKMASVASISPWHMSSQVSATVRSRWMPTLRLAATQPLPEIVQQLNDWRPDVLVAYASMERILAEEQIEGRLHIRPRVVFPASELLTEGTRQQIERAWGILPFNQYVSTEAAGIASEHHGDRRLHLYEDLVIPEVVDDRYQPVPPGEYGAKLLITTLFSHTQPLIRYELNDSVMISARRQTSGLPFRVVEGIRGRVEDTLLLPGRDGTRVIIRPLVFNRVMDILPISGWQVVQEADDRLTVLLSGPRNGLTSDMLIDKIAGELAIEGVHVPGIQVQHVDTIPKSSAGKAPLIKAYHPPSPAAEQVSRGS